MRVRALGAAATVVAVSVLTLLIQSPANAAAPTPPAPSGGSGGATKPVPAAQPARPVRHWDGTQVSLGGKGDRQRNSGPAAPAQSAPRGSSRACPVNNLCNLGGPVMSNVVIYNVYWVPIPRIDPNAPLVNQFTQDLGGPFAAMLAQYGVPNRVNYGGSWTDLKQLPTTMAPNQAIQIEDTDIQGVVTDAANANPNWNPPGLNTLYMVYLPAGTELCNEGFAECTYTPTRFGATGSFCAYHGAFTQSQSTFIYGAMPFDGDRLSGCGILNTATPGSTGSVGPNGDEAGNAEVSTASHEIFESLTDPEPATNAAWRNGTNPLDPGFLRGEIGDMCAYVFQPGPDGGDVSLNGNRYFIQQEWSNATTHCELPNDAILPSSTNPGCSTNALSANDDGSTGQISLPFSVNFFGTTYASLSVNNNGNVTFDGPLGTYTPFPLLSTNRVIVAPYFSDVDTRGQTPVPSGLVTYGSTTYGGRGAFCVNWRNVGYYFEHDEKLNSFQLLLVDRSDQGAGDFDVIFNYGRMQWETGDASGGSNGLGGGSARVGFSNGTTNSLELFDSGVNGALLDFGGQALTAGSHGSTDAGRYLFPVRNGSNGGAATIDGRVTDRATPPNSVAGAFVQVCGGVAPTRTCNLGTTNANGAYSITSLAAGTYEITVSPPAGSRLFGTSQTATLPANATLQVDIALDGPLPLPHGTTVGGSSTNPDGTPVLYWQTNTPITTHGCAGGTASVTVSADNSQTGLPGTVTATLTEQPAGSGTYVGAIPALYPLHGGATVHVAITCPNPADNSSFDFSIYIDPSGTVVDSDGAALAGATVTLYRADASTGPFVQVTNGSAIMSPGNRNNPDTTSATGGFGWDVITGYYKIRASKTGCVDPNNAAVNYVDSAVLPIPPAVAGIQMTLQCQVAPTITSVDHATFTVGAAGSFNLTSTGSPTPAWSETGALPGGVRFVDNHDGTATLAGIAGSGTAGGYNVTVRSANGVTPDASQSFSLTIAKAASSDRFDSQSNATEVRVACHLYRQSRRRLDQHRDAEWIGGVLPGRAAQPRRYHAGQRRPGGADHRRSRVRQPHDERDLPGRSELRHQRLRHPPDRDGGVQPQGYRHVQRGAGVVGGFNLFDKRHRHRGGHGPNWRLPRCGKQLDRRRPQRARRRIAARLRQQHRRRRFGPVGYWLGIGGGSRRRRMWPESRRGFACPAEQRQRS